MEDEGQWKVWVLRSYMLTKFVRCIQFSIRDVGFFIVKGTGNNL